MFERIRARLLHLMRVPPDPDPPAGAPGSLRVFRAGRNLYYVRLAHWGLGQAGALAGIVVSLVFLARVEVGVEQARAELARVRAERAAAGPATAPAVNGAGETGPGVAEPPAKERKARRAGGKERGLSSLVRFAERWPWWLFPVLTVLEWVGVLVYLLQIPVTYAMVRLDYELRWYMVTDRSLRIRTGIAVVQEATMSFANVQQVVVTQGPLQRMLAIADVRVQSAGGGGEQGESSLGHSLHTGIFHGVENAAEMRDLVVERLRRFRASGLGDPDDARESTATPTMTCCESNGSFDAQDAAGARHAITFATIDTGAKDGALAAAHEALAEARALHRAAILNG